MSYDAQTARRVRELLAARPGVAEKRMVGGLSFMIGTHMCCGVTRGGLMVRVGQQARGQALAEPFAGPMTIGGKSLGGYVLVEPAGYQDDAALAAWVQRGLDFVATLPAQP